MYGAANAIATIVATRVRSPLQAVIAVVAVMYGLGIDRSEVFPQPLTDEVLRAADVVITMGCGDACPLLPTERNEDWTIADPHGKAIVTVREIRDVIRERVQDLVASLEAPRSRRAGKQESPS